MKLKLLALTFLFPSIVFGAKTYKSDGSLGTVGNCTTAQTSPSGGVQWLHNNCAVDGDTITMPDGTFLWATTLTITKAITVKGNAQPNSSTGVIDTAHTVVKQSVSSGAIVVMGPIPGEPTIPTEWHPGDRFVRVTGIAFQPPTVTMTTPYHPAFYIRTTVPVRWDHISMNGLYHGGNYIQVERYNYGVVDHCIQKIPTVDIGAGEGTIYCNVNTPDKGDYAFNHPAEFGSYKFFFMEDNWVQHCSDLRAGGKLVWRYSHIHADECCRQGGHCISAGSFVSHGIGNNGGSGYRGGRALEMYNCDLWYDDPHPDNASMDGLTSGSAYLHDNTLSNKSAGGTIQPQVVFYGLSDYRYYNNEAAGGGFTGASGFSPWDINCQTKDAQGNCTSSGEGPGVIFYEGTTDTGTNDRTIVETAANWVSNQWKGYSVYRVSDGWVHVITGNTNNTLTLFGANHDTSKNFVPGQLFRIGKVMKPFDSPGFGAGDMINRQSPAWDHSVDEMSRAWNNRDIDRNPNPVLGFTGRCTGIYTCGPYSNSSPPPGTYTPYTYPHPLTGVSFPSPTPTASPTATATFTPTVTPTATFTPVPTPTATPSATPSATFTPTATATATATATSTPTPTPICTPPTAPSDLTCSTNGPFSISLHWTDNSNNETGFKLYRGSPNCTAVTQIATIGANVTNYSNGALTPNTTYCYQVRSYRSCVGLPDANSTPTNNISCTTNPTPTPTATATATFTPTPTATATFTPTPTPTPTASPTASPSPTATFTPTATATFTPTATATFTPTPTPSATFTPTPLPTPHQPHDLTLTVASCSETDLQWVYDFADQLGFRLYRSSDNVTFQQFDSIQVTEPGIYNFKYFFSPTGVSYYRVTAYSLGGEGLPLDGGPVTQPACSPTPTPTPGATPTVPRNVKVVTGTVLTWDANPEIEEVTLYHIYRFKGSSNNADGVATTSTTSQDVSEFVSGSRTNFAVSAENVSGEGEMSPKQTVQRH